MQFYDEFDTFLTHRLSLLQCQYSLLDRRPTNGMVEYCAANNIRLLPYGVLAGGFLSDAYLGVPASGCVIARMWCRCSHCAVQGQGGYVQQVKVWARPRRGGWVGLVAAAAGGAACGG